MLKQKYELFAVFIGRKGNDMAKKIKRFLVLVFVTFFCSLVSRGYNALLSWKNAKQTKSIFRLNAVQAGSVCCQYGICDCGNELILESKKILSRKHLCCEECTQNPKPGRAQEALPQ